MKTKPILGKLVFPFFISLLATLSLSAQSASTTPTLKNYVGEYKSDNIGLVTISTNGNMLEVNAGNMHLILQPESERVFIHAKRNLSFEFIQNEAGAFSRMIVRENAQQVDEAIWISSENHSLYEEILHMDSILFSAFNNQDQKTLQTLFTEDLEFFHDTGGLANYEQSMTSFEGLFSRDYVLSRRLIAGSAEVYPIKDYGAVMTGRHEFCHEENGQDDCGTFKFLHIWQKIDGKWKISRAVSYDH